MGVDLRLLPFDADHGEFAYSHTILSCERRRDLWEAIDQANFVEREVPEDFKSFTGKDPRSDEPCYGITTESPYGGKIMYVLVKDLLKLKDHRAVLENHTNRAIWAYLSELPPETKVALYWH